MSKFKKGDWVRFSFDLGFELTQESNVREYGVDPFKSYKVEKVTKYVDPDNWLVDINTKNGDGWGQDWFELDKKTTVLNIINDL